jgi:hypothetical protein
MNWAWTTSLDQIWRSPAFPMWLTLGAAGFFGIIVLITLLRAERSVANGALTVITLLAIAVAVAATIRGFGSPGANVAGNRSQSPPEMIATLPALSCIDDMASEPVLLACEKTLFGSPEVAAAAVSYAASRISRLTASGDVATANQSATPELLALRRSVERDRYGLMAYVLLTRDHCTPAECPVFRSLTDRTQLSANMEEHVYDGLVSRYAPTWNAPPPAAPASPAMGALASMPTGRPTNAEFPSASSTPPVSIMTPEPGQGGTRAPAANGPASRQNAAAPAAPANAPAPAARQSLAATPPPAKKPPKPRPPTPVQIAPAAPAPDAAPAPAASSD